MMHSTGWIAMYEFRRTLPFMGNKSAGMLLRRGQLNSVARSIGRYRKKPFASNFMNISINLEKLMFI